MDMAYAILKLILGLVFFLFGMNIMSSNLEKMAGGKLETLLKKSTSNTFVAMLLGLVITVTIQSSSATTVMLVGLVNSGIMHFSQTIGVIFGANIGTTLTTWILSLIGIESDSFFVNMLKPENFCSIIALAGIILLMLGKSDKKRSIGTILIGFTVLMTGMSTMSSAVEPLAEQAWFADVLVSFRNPILGVIAGTLFTAIIQSSAASVGVLQALSMRGMISYSVAIPIIMGQNIGTCITALISSIGTNVKAKRVVAVHLSINVIGTAICMAIYSVLNYAFDAAFMSRAITPFGIAIMHTLFNLIITFVLMPFTKQLAKLAELLVRDRKPGSEKKEKPVFSLDDRLLRSPSLAIAECNNATVDMSKIAHEMLTLAIESQSSYSPEKAQHIMDGEDKLDRFEDSLGTYLVKLSSQALSQDDSRKVSKMLHTIGDFERLGDHAVNLLKVSKEIKDKSVVFSTGAQRELKVLADAVTEILYITMTAYATDDTELAGRVEPLEQVIDCLISEIKNNHISRLKDGSCTINLGFILSDMLTNYERISDHCSNIAVAIIEVEHDSFDTHKYLNSIKHGSAKFDEVFDSFANKYKIV